MKQAHYLMTATGLHVLKSHFHGTGTMRAVGDSWEEKAFAEDVSGDFGCVWPPRSYLCSFCNREFRSAQALGGHMNVHRRDRARLKQSALSDPSEETQSQIRNSGFPHHHVSQHEVGANDSGHNFDLNYNPSFSYASPLPRVSSKMSSSSSYDKRVCTSERLLPSPYFSSLLVQKEQKGYPVTGSFFNLATSKAQSKLEKNQLELNRKNLKQENDFAGINLSCQTVPQPMGLESNFSHHPSISDSCHDEAVSVKRPKTSASSLLTFHVIYDTCSSHDGCPPKSDAVTSGLKVSSMEDELDLELRLGNPPKLK